MILTSALIPLPNPGKRVISTFCTPVCHPVERKTVAVKRIPMMNDLMSMEFIQSQAYES